MLIAVEGVSYSGKSTLISGLKKYYGKSNIVTVGREKDNNVELSLRELIRNFSSELSIEEEMFLFAARLNNKVNLIKHKQKKRFSDK